MDCNNKTLLYIFIGIVVGVELSLIIYYSLIFGYHNGLLNIKDLIGYQYPTDHQNDDKLSNQIFDKVKIVCLVLTSPDNHDKKAKHVHATWGKRCNKILFISSAPHETLPIVQLEVEGYENLWGKTKAAFKYVYENHIDEYDWFYKADDDTYAIMENMRYMLSMYDFKDPIFFGHKFSPYVEKGYMSGGAGYILSKEAVKRFVEVALPNKDICKQDNTGAEDVEMGKCLMSIGVIAGDSRDESGRNRFFPLPPKNHINSFGIPDWFHRNTYYKIQEDTDCCSDTTISFHYVDPNLMHEMEFFIYHLKPYGIANKLQFPPNLPPDLLSVPKRLTFKLRKNQKKVSRKVRSLCSLDRLKKNIDSKAF